jgi:hypothetical protein
MFRLIIDERQTNSNSAALTTEMWLMMKYNRWHVKNPSQQRPVTRNQGQGLVQAYVEFETEEEAALYKLTNWESLHG